MDRYQTARAKPSGILLRIRDTLSGKGWAAWLILITQSASWLLNPLRAQDSMGRQYFRGSHQPAYRFRGTSLSTLQSIPLPAQTTVTAGNLNPASEPASASNGSEIEFAGNRILVSFQDNIASSEKSRILNQASAELMLDPAASGSFFDTVRIAGAGITPGEAVARLRNDPRIRIAEPDYIVHTQDKIPNDPNFIYLWGLRNTGQGTYDPANCTTCSKPGADVSAAKAWDLTTGSSQVVVGVIDTGVDYNHPDLAANILRDASNKIVGYDYVNKDEDPMDDHGHGTHCSGTIGAVGNNGVGIAGVCWTVKIMPLKFLNSSGSGSTSDAISCVDFAIAHGAHILSNSWGGGGFSQLLLEAIRRAEKAGILFVAAAGNYAQNTDVGGFYPAGYNQFASNVISVAATDPYDTLATFSNYGPSTVDIAAPGVSIYSTLPSGNCYLCNPKGYGYLSGTSMAAPHVSGTAALIKAKYPDASLTTLRARLRYSGDHPVEMDGYTLKGRLNANSAIQSDTIPPGAPANFSITDASGTGLRMTWTASGEDNLTGTVSAYQVFYSTVPDMAMAVTVEPRMTPGPPGKGETIDLTGLIPNTVYYVSLRAVDKVGNTSSLVAAPATATNGAAFTDGAEGTPAFASTYGPPWTADTGNFLRGQRSYASPAALPASQSSSMQMVSAYVPTGPAYAVFWAKMDLDPSSDGLNWSVYDVTANRYSYGYVGSGTTGWAQYRFSLSPYVGHSIKIGFYLYKGANASSSSSHMVWLDEVAIVQLAKGWVDDVEGTPQFTGFPPWRVTAESSSSPSHAWSDSPNSKYVHNVQLPLMQNSAVVPPSGLGSLSLAFRAKIDLEANRDYLEVYGSPDDGANWQYLGALTGTSDWTTYSFDLPGWTKVRALFVLVTNAAIARDGVYLDDIGVWGESFVAAQKIPGSTERTAVSIAVPGGGASTAFTSGASGALQTGYAAACLNSGGMPYGTAVLSLTQGNIIVSEAAVMASPPTVAARAFIDYRTGVAVGAAGSGAGTVDINTGLALVNRGSGTANMMFTLRDATGLILAVGRGTLSAGAHTSKFINQLNDVAPDFKLPAGFAAAIKFGSLEIISDQPISILALRLTVNQRGDPLLTSTPVADLSQSPGNLPLYFPQFADGGGYTTSIILLNSSSILETGAITFWGDDGSAASVTADGGSKASSFPYSIQPGGVFVFQTNGAPASALTGWVKVTPGASSLSPSGAGIFRYSSGGTTVTESGVPAAVPTTHARIFVDQSTGHETGLAIASSNTSATKVAVKAYLADGSTSAGIAADPLNLNPNGHSASFVGQLIAGLPQSFSGVLDISAPSPFVALTLRSLRNERKDVLLTTFPVADLLRPAPSPIVFPQIAAGGGYLTQFIMLGAGTASDTTVCFYDDRGFPLAIGK